jgi:hypothetical protein
MNSNVPLVEALRVVSGSHSSEALAIGGELEPIIALGQAQASDPHRVGHGRDAEANRVGRGRLSAGGIRAAEDDRDIGWAESDAHLLGRIGERCEG